jgi:uncharacterized damage-inducible protein DinB
MCNKSHDYTINQALTSLAGTARRLERLVAGLSATKATARPSPDKWSAKEIVCHLADCELVYGLRYRTIISEPGSVLTAFDQDAWANNLQYRQQSLKGALTTFKALRSGHIALLKGLPEAAWNKSGQHASYGELTLQQLVTHLVDHDRNHTAQVEHLSRAAGAKKA